MIVVYIEIVRYLNFMYYKKKMFNLFLYLSWEKCDLIVMLYCGIIVCNLFYIIFF